MKDFKFLPFPAYVFDQSRPLQIDRAIKKLATGRRGARLLPRWSVNPDEAKLFGRRLLNFSGLSAQRAIQRDLSSVNYNWEVVANSALAASNSSAKAIQALARIDNINSGREVLGIERPVARAVADHLCSMYLSDEIRRVGDIKDGKGTRAKAETDCERLFKTLHILQWISHQAREIHSRTSANYQNPGSPQKLKFVRHMTEGWIYLVGRCPSESSTPFCNFLNDGWSDICEQEAGDWRHAIRTISAELAPDEIASLVEQGPFWL